MSKIAVIGAGITGITTAYSLSKAGHEVVVIDRHRYPAMETSFANGGQLSASNAEVWNSVSTILKALRWMFRSDAPLLFDPAPSWHKYSWIAEFLWNIRKHGENTIETVRLAIEARSHLLKIAEDEKIDFDFVQRGILHVCRTEGAFKAGIETSALLSAGGLQRIPVNPKEICDLEPALKGAYYGGFFTPSDSTGDIHKFTRGLAKACADRGVKFIQEGNVKSFRINDRGLTVVISRSNSLHPHRAMVAEIIDVDIEKIIVCAGVESREIAAMLGDRINIYPVKGYSVTIQLGDRGSQEAAPTVSLLDDEAKIVTSRLGSDRFRVAGTAEFNGFNRDIRADRIDPLLGWVRSNFPDVDTSSVVPWSGLRPMMPNMMPVFRAGRRPGVFYNTGHGHLGWTLACATAAILAQIVELKARD